MSVLALGDTCCSIAPIERAGVLVDGRAYYRSFHRTALGAERYILLAGWQFDSRVRLVRGDDDRGDEPAELAAFLDHLCHERPELRVWVLSWDYNLVYTLEREWLQRLRFDLRTHERLKFRLDGEHPVGASHHQKVAIVDGAIAYVGGMDLCASRWDDRRHVLDHPERARSRARRPYHEVTSFVTGEAVRSLEALFAERWRIATGESIALPPPRSLPIDVSGAIEIPAREVGISRTFVDVSVEPERRVEEIRALYQAAIASAERSIYLENQYFTSTALRDALLQRLGDTSRPRLSVVLVLPRGADSPKEKLALGAMQERVLASIEEEALRHGHEMRVLYSAVSDDDGEEVATFIHSQLMIVDDRFLTVGSANLTNRSLGLDSELNLSWEADVTQVRASLLAEHAGISDLDVLADPETWSERLSELSADPASRLRRRAIDRSVGDQDPWLGLAFDSAQPLDSALEQALAKEESELEAALFGSTLGRWVGKLLR
jgi:phosphatidylserine/phosphatidylglycerophosphate/cardiolipin synthase-like enzyme